MLFCKTTVMVHLIGIDRVNLSCFFFGKVSSSLIYT